MKVNLFEAQLLDSYLQFISHGAISKAMHQFQLDLHYEKYDHKLRRAQRSPAGNACSRGGPGVPDHPRMAADCWDDVAVKKTNTEETLKVMGIRAITHYANKVTFVALYKI